MRTTLCTLIAATATAALPGIASAASMEDAFVASGETCADITWKQSVLEQYPQIGDACQGVELREDGKYYVRFSGKVRNVSATGNRVGILFDGADATTTLDVPTGQRINVGGRNIRTSDLSRGDELTFHVPSDQFVAHFYEPEEAGEESEFVAVEFTDEPASDSYGSSLPTTASMLPWLAVSGFGLWIAGGLAWIFGRRRSR